MEADNNTKWYLENINNKIKYYVKTNKYSEATKILNKKNILIIHGEPGIGKTTLAEMLVLNYINKEYKFHYLSGNSINDLEAIIKNNFDREVILIDDFLGKNILELNNFQQTRFETFLERMIKYNKKLILTTRTYIYKSINLEILDKQHCNIEEFLLPITSYTKLEKAKILYNHLYFKIDKKFLQVISENEQYKKIIEHKNYNPRIIEMITKLENIKNIKKENYLKYVYSKLNNPNEIWKFEYSKLNHKEKLILTIIASFIGLADEYKVRKVFHSIYPKKEFIYTNLINSFINITINNFTNEKNLSFINPSLKDYIIANIFTDQNILEILINNTLYLDQFNFFEKIGILINLSKKELLNLLFFRWNKLDEKIPKKEVFLIETFSTELLQVSHNYKSKVVKTNYLKHIKDQYTSEKALKYIDFLIKFSKNNSKIMKEYNFITLLKNLKGKSEFSKYLVLLKLNFDFDKFFINNKKNFEKSISDILIYELDNFFLDYYEKDNTEKNLDKLDINTLESKIKNNILNDMLKELDNTYINKDYLIKDLFNKIKYQHKANKFNMIHEKFHEDDDNYLEDNELLYDLDLDEDKLIEVLFEKFHK